ncbi:hypothetical protein FI667_g13654, partial [Globisporangium splendens]
MAFGKKKEGLYLRPRVRRTTPLMDIAFAVVIGGASGIYIFNDTMRRWQQSELMECGELDMAAANPTSADAKDSMNDNVKVSNGTDTSDWDGPVKCDVHCCLPYKKNK